MGSEARARLALFGLLFATLLAFGQLFAESTYSEPAVFGMLLALAITVGGRRLGLSSLVTALISMFALVWFLCVVFESTHLFFGLPSLEAIERIGRSLERAATQSNVDFAPVPVRAGYVILTVAAMWIVTTFAELATFRWRRPVLATLPALALFCFLLVVGSGSGSWFLVTIFLSAMLAFWGLESSHRLRSWGRWVEAFGESEKAGDPIMARVGRRMGVSCVAVALVAPLMLPAIDKGLLSWRNSIGNGGGSGGGGRIDLLVDIRPKLLEQSDTRLFRVRAADSTYWRLASLAQFDGNVWSPGFDGEFSQTTEGAVAVSHRIPVDEGAEVLEQRFTILELGGDSLPAAITPVEVGMEDQEGRSLDDVTSHTATGELRLDADLVPGLGYQVTSVMPALSFEELEDAPIGELEDRLYSELPATSIAPLADIAQRWTRTATTPFTKLVAIQDKLRSDFQYSQSPELVQSSASSDYLLTFLQETRTGYCQQFAASFAALARSLGYPSRVSVGFLPGSPDPNDPENFLVRGTDAHAWPEVYFRDHGWVAFEPTPRAGAASASAPLYTEQGLDSPIGFGAFNGDPQSGQANRELNLNDFGEDPRTQREGGIGEGAAAGNDPRRARGLWFETFRDLLAIVGLIAATVLVLVPVLKELRIRRRYRRARDPVRVAEAAFTTFEREAAELASPRRPAESASAFARRLGGSHAVPADRATRLAGIYEAAEYSLEGISEGQANEARSLATELRSRLWKRASWYEKVRRLFSPRSLAT